MRIDGRKNNELRKIKFTKKGPIKYRSFLSLENFYNLLILVV